MEGKSQRSSPTLNSGRTGVSLKRRRRRRRRRTRRTRRRRTRRRRRRRTRRNYNQFVNNTNIIPEFSDDCYF